MTHTNLFFSLFDAASAEMQLALNPQVLAAVHRPSVERRRLEIHLVEGTLLRAVVAKMT